VIRIGIYGYGNLGKGVELAAAQNSDFSLVGVFTRRNPEKVQTLTGAPVYRAERVTEFADEIDVLVICGGSATDLPEMTPALAQTFNVVDSFDHHAKIPEHFLRVNEAAMAGGCTALISGGWDPGLFSLARLYGEAVLPDGVSDTFWGRGVSQGHSDAIRRIPGVIDARQYTVPVASALESAREGEKRAFSAREKHTRECFVVPAEGADLAQIEREIKEMPDYFKEYDTTVSFITLEELREKHSGLPHGGTVIRTGETGGRIKELGGATERTDRPRTNRERIEFSLKLESNPEFTGSVLVALARAVYKMSARGDFGCKTVFDVAPADLSPKSREELLKALL